MPGLLEEFYGEDMNQYYYVEEEGPLYYYEDEEEEVEYYYIDDDGEDVVYYSDEILYMDEYYNDEAYGEEPIFYQDEILYYEEEEPAMFFKKEINIAPRTINTPRDAQGNAWSADTYEIDKEIENIADEEGVDYATAYRMFGQRYESYEPDLSDYV